MSPHSLPVVMNIHVVPYYYQGYLRRSLKRHASLMDAVARRRRGMHGID